MSIQNITKFRVEKPAKEAFEAFVDPAKIGNFWFSGSSCRWESGKTVTLRYVEYNAEFDIRVVETIANQKIEFKWGEGDEENTVTIKFSETFPKTTIIEITEIGWNKNDPDLTAKLVGNKEGWVYMLTCLKAYLENSINTLRAGLIHE